MWQAAAYPPSNSRTILMTNGKSVFIGRHQGVPGFEYLVEKRTKTGPVLECIHGITHWMDIRPAYACAVFAAQRSRSGGRQMSDNQPNQSESGSPASPCWADRFDWDLPWAVRHAVKCWYRQTDEYPEALDLLQHRLGCMFSDDELAILYRAMVKYKHAGFNQHFVEPS
jgi:hypothetical protein